jgi:AraC family transcriptional regulator
MLRMEVATSSLARSSMPIAHIADLCGYSAQSHFTRFFVQQIGITPGEYRRAASGSA